ncbi:MAG: trigger factor [Muribaculaceae bacterium]|jgi:trigger factor|nr:trigger factor [Muribaculaceae bacterium]MBQ1185390.1 trigger factor [Muribaculaceae bacterium]MBQ2370704.1 trigger factor [Muribaculaceae bacterium]MBQ5723877.1 trigger factor [Muribaculaceae bacterium]
MNVTINKIDAVNATITVSLEEKDYQDKVKKALRDINMTRPEPGFRPGKVPAGLIQKKYGKAVKYDVVNKEVTDALFNYIKDNEIQVLGNPVPATKEEFDLEAADYTFTFNVGVAPEIDTHVNKDLTVPYYTIEVSDEMVDRQSDMYRNRYGAQVPGETVEPNALVKGVITELNEDGSIKEGGILNENGIVSPQYFKNDDQRAAFMDKKLGDVVKFNPWVACGESVVELSSMLNIDKEVAENTKSEFNLEIKEIIVLRQAELNQEFFDNAVGKDKAHNEEEYRAALKEMIEKQLSSDSNYRFSIDAKEAIQKAVGDIELPDAVLKEFLMQQDENLNEENIETEYQRIRPDLVWQLTREAIAKQLELKVEEQDILAVARMLAQSQFAQYGMTNLPDDVLDKYGRDILNDPKSREHVVNQAVDMKLYYAIRENVTIDNKTVSVQQFNELFAPAEA